MIIQFFKTTYRVLKVIKDITKYFEGRWAGIDVVRTTSKCRIMLHCVLISFYTQSTIDTHHVQSRNQSIGLFDCPDLVFDFPILADDLILSYLKVFLFWHLIFLATHTAQIIRLVIEAWLSCFQQGIILQKYVCVKSWRFNI